MNSKITILTISLLFLTISLFAEGTFNASVEVNRYVQGKATQFEIIYKIPNNQLTFIKAANGFLAPIDATFSLYKGEKEVQTVNFSCTPAAINLIQTQKDSYYFLDKITFPLSWSGLSAKLTIKDTNSGKTFQWTQELKLLPAKTYISDLEFSSKIVNDTTSYLDKFHRNGRLYYADPAHVYQSYQDSVFLYYEIQNLKKGTQGYRYSQELIISKDAVPLWTQIDTVEVNNLPATMENKFACDYLDTGGYKLEMRIKDLVSDSVQTITDTFSKVQITLNSARIFPNDEDEFALIRYFLSANQQQIWKTLSPIAQKNFISKFWSARNPNPSADKNQFIETVKERVDYANTNYSALVKGWKTDIGRVYIRMGKPDEEIKDITDANSKYSQKEYKIWKYRKTDRVYIFMDFKRNGNYELIYADNDQNEQTDSNWRSYFQEDWDDSMLNQ